MRNFQDDIKVYNAALSSFIRNHSGDFEAISDGLERGDIEGARRVAHTLKSTAAAIGAERLRRAAMVAEQQLAAAGTVNEEVLDTLRSQLALALTAIEESGLLVKDDVAASGSTLDSASVLAMLEKISPLLESGNADVLNFVNELKDNLIPLGEQASTFLDYIEDLDFAAAYYTLPALMRAIQEHCE
jgi:HPt (histidine-containing phosphotransfer) domain-containing protein